MKGLIRVLLPHLSVIAIFLVASALYFSPQLSGKVIQQSDIIQVRSMSKEMDDYRAKTGEPALWTNSIFCGMPTYQINTIHAGNQTGWVDRAMQLFIARPIGRFFSAMLAFYLLMLVLRVPMWAGAFGAIIFGLSTNNLILFEAGHTSKVSAIAYLPLLAAGALLAFRRQYLAGAAIFGLGTALELYANHVQMTYYFVLTLGFFGIARLIYDLRQGEGLHFAKAAAGLIVGGLLGLATAASNLLPTYEYAKDTMRGDGVLPKTAAATPASTATAPAKSKGGLEYDYAMQWSNNTLDLFATLIPGVAGGGSQEPVGKSSQTLSDLRTKGFQVPDNFKLPLYWGGLPFTSGPAYLGAVVLFLFGMGLVLVKGPEKWWLALGVLLTMLLSLGKNFGSINQLLYEVLPLYNKFRAPSSMLSVTAFLAAALGFLGLGAMTAAEQDRKKVLQALLYVGGTFGVITLYFALLGGGMYSFSSEGDPRLQQQGLDLAAIVADRKAKMSSDAWRSFFFIALCAGLIWAWATEKIKANVLFIGVGLLGVMDMWGVGRRYLNEESFVTQTNYQSNFAPRPVDEQILADKTLHYRVHDLTIDSYNSAQASYFHKTVGGYNAAKLQRFQDLIERHLSKGNQEVFNMLNTRYFIVQGPTPAQGQAPSAVAQLNPQALGNAWFVQRVKSVGTALEEISALDSFSAREEAIVHREFASYLQGFQPQLDSNARIQLLSYAPQALTYTSKTQSEQLAVFSEVWYGPDKGWQAYLDGQPVPHIRANYLLRALRVPAGEHKIEFKFEPRSYRQGKALSTASSWALLLGGLGLLGWNLRQLPTDPAPAPAAPVAPKPQPTAPPVPQQAPRAKSGNPTTTSKKKKKR